jgi:hypothetical protein
LENCSRLMTAPNDEVAHNALATKDWNFIAERMTEYQTTSKAACRDTEAYMCSCTPALHTNRSQYIHPRLQPHAHSFTHVVRPLDATSRQESHKATTRSSATVPAGSELPEPDSFHRNYDVRCFPRISCAQTLDEMSLFLASRYR